MWRQRRLLRFGNCVNGKNEMEHPLIDQLRANNADIMPAQDTKVLVALSGGADSVALLRALLQLGYL